MRRLLLSLILFSSFNSLSWEIIDTMYVTQGSFNKELNVKLHTDDPYTDYVYHELIWDSTTNTGTVNLYFKSCNGPYGLFYYDTVFTLNHPNFPSEYNIALRTMVATNPNGDYICPPLPPGPNPTIDIDTLTIEEQQMSTNDFLLKNTVIYPNPTTSYLKVDCENYSINRLILVNCAGIILKQSNSNTLTQLNEFDSGVYFLLIHVGEAVLTKKIMIL